MESKRKAAAPKTLGEEGAKFWREMAGQYEFSTPELRILEQAALALDRIALLQEALDDAKEQGLLATRTRTGEIKMHPGFDAMNSAHRTFSAAVKSLNLPAEDAIQSAATQKGKALAAARWAAK